MNRKQSHLRIVNGRTITGAILLVTLIASIVYSITQIVLSPSASTGVLIHQRLKSDYVLMLLQCSLGVIVMAVPSILARKWSIGIPNYMYVLYFLFLYCAIYLGEVRNFYYTIPHWDTILHCFSAGMLGFFGFILVDIFNSSEKVKIQLSPFFVSMFAFCFAVSIGALWEIYEYTFDGLLSLNMQKYALENGTLLIGRAALSDTMKDIIVDAVSAFTISCIGFYMLHRRQRIRT